MKTIKDLDVKVTYRVGLGDVEASDEVFEQLNKIAENGGEIDGMGMEYPLLNYHAFSCIYPSKANYSIKSLAHDFYLEYYNVDFTEQQLQYMLSSLSPTGANICE